MAWIKTIPQEQATGLLKELYTGFAKNPNFGGRLPNILQAFSLRPEVLEAVSRFFQSATFGASHLARVQEEMIATVVSSLNRCHY